MTNHEQGWRPRGTILAKDLLLVEAALETDKRIVSRDSEACDCYRELAESGSSIKDVHWANPIDDACLSWIGEGAPRRATLQLPPRAGGR